MACGSPVKFLKKKESGCELKLLAADGFPGSIGGWQAVHARINSETVSPNSYSFPYTEHQSALCLDH